MEIENKVTLPLETEVDGCKWNLFSAEWTGADGRFGFYFYAISP